MRRYGRASGTWAHDGNIAVVCVAPATWSSAGGACTRPTARSACAAGEALAVAVERRVAQSLFVIATAVTISSGAAKDGRELPA